VSRSNRIIRLFVLALSIAVFGADLDVSAQNANSSTTTPQEDTATQNDNMSNMNMNRGGRRRRRGRRRGGNMNAADTTAADTPTDTTTMTPVRTGRCDPMAQEQTDLSGTYTGTVNYSEGGLSGDATLTITGNDFTMTSGSTTQEGRVVAVTTCNYTAVTMRFGRDTTVAPGTTPPPALPTVSLRARRVGNGLTLTSVPGESRQFSFSSGGGGGGMADRRGGRRRRRRMARPQAEAIKPPTVMTHAHRVSAMNDN
jgi:hypothetical protein